MAAVEFDEAFGLEVIRADMLAFAMRVGRFGESDADDLVQTAFARFFERQRSAGVRFDLPSTRALLFTVLKYVFKEEWRAQKRRPLQLVSDTDSTFFVDGPELDSDFDIDDCLSVLPGRERDVMCLFLAGLNNRDIAFLLSVSPVTVRVTRHRAMQRLSRLQFQTDFSGHRRGTATKPALCEVGTSAAPLPAQSPQRSLGAASR